MERIGVILRMGATQNSVEYLNREQTAVVKTVDRSKLSKRQDQDLVRRIRNHFAEVNSAV